MKLQPQIINEFPPYPKLSINTHLIDMSEGNETGLIHTKTTISSKIRLLRDGVYYLLDVATCYEIFGEHREDCLKNAMEEFTRDAYVASILHETVEFMDKDKDQTSEKERMYRNGKIID